MALPLWDRPFCRYVVRGSFTRADTFGSTAGAVLLAIIAHIIGLEGSKMLSADDFSRSVEIAFAAFIAIWSAIIICRACWWPFHWRLEKHGGLSIFLSARLGTFMWPIILTVTGFVAFVLLTGIGVIWLSLQVLNGSGVKVASNTPNTVGNPDFTLSVPQDRYRFTWPSSNLMQFYLRRDSDQNPNISNNPAFVLRNLTDTVAYRVSALWTSETAINLDELAKTPKLSKATFQIKGYQIDIIGTKDMPFGNFRYFLDPSPKQLIPVIAKEDEVYFPSQIWPLAAMYFIDKTPDGIGQTSPPFIVTASINWETSKGKKQKLYRVRVTATNAKTTSDVFPIIDTYLNFALEEVKQ